MGKPVLILIGKLVIESEDKKQTELQDINFPQHKYILNFIKYFKNIYIKLIYMYIMCNQKYRFVKKIDSTTIHWI